MIEYTPQECKKIIHNCKNINEIFTVSDQLKFALNHNMINMYYRKFLENCINTKINLL